MLESNVSNQDYQESLNASTSRGIVNDETNEAPHVMDEVLESNVSNQDAQESPNASTSLEVV